MKEKLFILLTLLFLLMQNSSSAQNKAEKKAAKNKANKDKARTHAKNNCLELKICDFDSNYNFSANLATLKLKKGDFFSVKIHGINPYLYDIKVSTQNDTFSTGTPPALFSTFMDISKLGDIVSNISNLTGAVNLAAAEEVKDEPLPEEILDLFENLSLTDTMQLNSIKREALKYFKTTEKKNQFNKKFNRFQEHLEDLNEIKNLIKTLAQQIEENYNSINDCYTTSILSVYNTQLDCNSKVPACTPNLDCKCIKDSLKIHITQLTNNKYKLTQLLNEQIAKKTDSILKIAYSKLVTELQSSKYSVLYLNRIYAKTYSNFSIAENAASLLTYYSFPIQAQADKLELKIDITPKSSSKEPAKDSAKEEEEKNEDNTNNNTNNLSNQSPVTINIDTDSKKEKPDDKPATETKTPTPDKTATEDKLSNDDLKITMPTGLREYHLNYKYRTSRMWYGFSAGCFVDQLYDDIYTNKPVDPLNSGSRYTVIKESSKDFYKYGIMASVNGGLYFSRKCDWFLTVFTGPGFSIEPKLQPRLLIGVGIGCGDANKFSVNGGVSIGQVKRLSNAIDLDQEYAVPQTNLYYTRNAVSPFIALTYTFGLERNTSDTEK